MSKLCPICAMHNGKFIECAETDCAWFDDEVGKCEIANLSLISKIPLDLKLLRESGV